MTLLLVQSMAASGQKTTRAAAGPLTRAEATGYVETSRYADVVAFLAAVDSLSPAIHLTRFGYTVEGRALPLAVWGAPAAGAEAVRATGKTRVLVMANIHAGEVEGKEASLMLLREIAGGAHPEWADSLVLLVAPIYNVDGNERVALDNRPLQLGPVGGMGQRPNARGLDLNRDYMKLESPEARSLVGLFNDYDPHVVVDLHTTNGTIHAYHLTYSPPLAPDTDGGITAFLTNDWLPAVTRAMAPERPIYHYGNLPADEGFEAERGWYTFSPQPRFGNNYVGLRNRFAILSEAYSYLPFEERIRVTRIFVEEIIGFAWSHAGEIRRRTDAADRADIVGETLGTRFEYERSTRTVEILLGEVDTLAHPHTGEPMLARRDIVRPERMPEFVAFRAIETQVAPAAYLVPAELGEALGLLAAHGIRMEPLPEEQEIDVEVFRIVASSLAEEAFQGHRERSIEGEWGAAARTVPAGTVVVRMDQPLARLAFHLLEPRSADGLVAWNVLDPALEEAEQYPILRVRAAVGYSSEASCALARLTDGWSSGSAACQRRMKRR